MNVRLVIIFWSFLTFLAHTASSLHIPNYHVFLGAIMVTPSLERTCTSVLSASNVHDAPTLLTDSENGNVSNTVSESGENIF